MPDTRAILHSDMNCFYASVEMMLNPSLRGKPVAVCGATEDRHGIVLAKSEPAKKAGIKTGMVNFEARQLCPDVIFVHPHYEQYMKYSMLAHEIYYRYTELVEPFGMDECWLDVSESTSLFGSPYQIAEEIRNAIKSELGLTVSIGVSFNKIFAKLGSDMKKPDAVTEITKDNFTEKVWPLSVSELLYAGRSTTARLNGYGIYTIGDLASTDPTLLQSWFGINGIKLLRYANGTDDSRVMHRNFVSPVKSIGHGITCTANLENEDEVRRVILELSQDVGHKLRVHGLRATGVQISVRTSELFGMQYQCRLPVSTTVPSEIAHYGFELFRSRYIWNQPVRAITIRAISLEPSDEIVQLDLFNNYERMDKLNEIQTAVEDIRRRFGKKSIRPASLFTDLKMPEHSDKEIIMPGIMYS